MRSEEQWVTTRMFTAVIASALVLPGLVPLFEAFRLRSMALFLTGLFLLLGFGVSYYILLRWFLEMDTAARPSLTRQFSIVDLENAKSRQGECDREGDEGKARGKTVMTKVASPGPAAVRAKDEQKRLLANTERDERRV